MYIFIVYFQYHKINSIYIGLLCFSKKLIFQKFTRNLSRQITRWRGLVLHENICIQRRRNSEKSTLRKNSNASAIVRIVDTNTSTVHCPIIMEICQGLRSREMLFPSPVEGNWISISWNFKAKSVLYTYTRSYLSKSKLASKFESLRRRFGTFSRNNDKSDVIGWQHLGCGFRIIGIETMQDREIQFYEFPFFLLFTFVHAKFSFSRHIGIDWEFLGEESKLYLSCLLV